MIFEQFTNYQLNNDYYPCMVGENTERRKFNEFAKEFLSCNPREESLISIMYDVYQLQCCMEGIIEDMEFGGKE